MKRTLKFLLVAVGGWLLYSLSCVGSASADPTAVSTWQPAASPDVLGLEGRIAAWVLALYGVTRTVLEVLKAIAPRTSTTVDDQVRDALAAILSDSRTPVERPRPPQAGRARLGALLGTVTAGLAIGAVVGMVAVALGCGPIERGAAAGKTAAIQCGKQYGPIVASALARWGVESAIARDVDVAKLESTALGLGLGAGSCFVAEVRRAWQAVQPVGVAALGGEPDMVTKLSAVLARVSGGATVVLEDGTAVQ